MRRIQYRVRYVSRRAPGIAAPVAIASRRGPSAPRRHSRPRAECRCDRTSEGTSPRGEDRRRSSDRLGRRSRARGRWREQRAAPRARTCQAPACRMFGTAVTNTRRRETSPAVSARRRARWRERGLVHWRTFWECHVVPASDIAAEHSRSRYQKPKERQNAWWACVTAFGTRWRFP